MALRLSFDRVLDNAGLFALTPARSRRSVRDELQRRGASMSFTRTSRHESPTEHRTDRHRPRVRRLCVILALACAGCNQGGGGTQRGAGRADLAAVLTTEHRTVNEFLTAADVTEVTRRAAESIDATTMVIAVTDREGQVLAVLRKPDAPATVIGNFGVTVNANDFAVSLARTASFFSNDQAPLSSRTVRFISGVHFPPGITNKPNGALYGIENTSRGCPLTSPPATPDFNPGQAVAPSTSLNGLPCNAADARGCGTGIATGKPDTLDSDFTSVTGGGVAIFKVGQVVGGVGVAGVAPNLAEFAAFVASIPSGRFGPRPADPGVILLDGIQLPFVAQTTRPPGSSTGTLVGSAFVVAPIDSPRMAAGVPDGWLIGPVASTELSQSDITVIVSQAVAQAGVTRAAIRLPLGSTTRMVIAVSDLQGAIRGLFRMPDSTVFSIDVAVAKARNVIYFSSFNRVPSDLSGVPQGTAVTSRTTGFGPAESIRADQIVIGGARLPFLKFPRNPDGP